MKKIFFLCCVLFLSSEKSALAADQQITVILIQDGVPQQHVPADQVYVLEDDAASRGFLSKYVMEGATWDSLPLESQGFYIQGVLDSWEFRDLSMRNVERGVELSTEGQANHYIALCLRAREMKLGQITAIVQNYITDNLNEWHRPMVLIVYSVLANACIKGLKAP